jgi:uncharacterized membrane protein YkvA (DUF1232 family)
MYSFGQDLFDNQPGYQTSPLTKWETKNITFSKEVMMPDFTEKQVEDEFDKYSRNVTEDDVSGVLDKEDEILGKAHGPLEKFAQNIKLLFSVVKDYASGNYKEIPWTTIAAIIGSLLYVFSPIDLVPDFIPFVGLLDDAAVMSVCLAGIGRDLKKYEIWKRRNAVEYKIIEEIPREQKLLSRNVHVKEDDDDDEGKYDDRW